MNEMSFLLGIAIALAFSLAVVVYLRRRLRTILIDLCGTEDRAGFWTAFSNVTLVLVPLICALFERPESGRVLDLFAVASQIQWALIGLVAALALVGLVISVYIPRASPSR